MPIEGVIKFDLHHQPGELPDDLDVSELNAWRRICFQLGLVGQQADRYEGYGFGNLSRRNVAEKNVVFVITGTQTGHLPNLERDHYTCVTSYDAAHNRVDARGPLPPSSESLTHGMVYDLDPAAQAVFHVHSPHLWRHATALGLPQTRADVEYGTPAMAAEVARLFEQTDVARRKIFSMPGHEDGILTFGNDCAEAGTVLVEALACAYALAPGSPAPGTPVAGSGRSL